MCNRLIDKPQNHECLWRKNSPPIAIATVGNPGIPGSGSCRESADSEVANVFSFQFNSTLIPYSWVVIYCYTRNTSFFESQKQKNTWTMTFMVCRRTNEAKTCEWMNWIEWMVYTRWWRSSRLSNEEIVVEWWNRWCCRVRVVGMGELSRHRACQILAREFCSGRWNILGCRWGYRRVVWLVCTGGRLGVVGWSLDEDMVHGRKSLWWNRRRWMYSRDVRMSSRRRMGIFRQWKQGHRSGWHTRPLVSLCLEAWLQ